MTFDDFVNYYSTIQKSYWYAVATGPEDYYYSPEESLTIVELLLKFQLDEEHHMEKSESECIQKFIQDLYDVLEKKLPKVNTFYIESPPSAGKNFLLDAVTSWYLNVGQIQNFNKYNNFPLMEAINRRVNVWNEPNIEPAAFDTVKMLLAGDPLKAAVKYQNEQFLLRTPVIVMTNKPCFPKNEMFTDRMIIYKWKRAVFLRKYVQKINPQVWPLLVNKYIKV